VVLVLVALVLRRLVVVLVVRLLSPSRRVVVGRPGWPARL
jgi:hypothetical protein